MDWETTRRRLSSQTCPRSSRIRSRLQETKSDTLVLFWQLVKKSCRKIKTNKTKQNTLPVINVMHKVSPWNNSATLKVLNVRNSEDLFHLVVVVGGTQNHQHKNTPKHPGSILTLKNVKFQLMSSSLSGHPGCILAAFPPGALRATLRWMGKPLRDCGWKWNLTHFCHHLVYKKSSAC